MLHNVPSPRISFHRVTKHCQCDDVKYWRLTSNTYERLQKWTELRVSYGVLMATLVDALGLFVWIRVAHTVQFLLVYGGWKQCEANEGEYDRKID